LIGIKGVDDGDDDAYIVRSFKEAWKLLLSNIILDSSNPICMPFKFEGGKGVLFLTNVSVFGNVYGLLTFHNLAYGTMTMSN
jgi:hypothetical protein